MNNTEASIFFERNWEALRKSARKVTQKYDWILEPDDADDIEIQAAQKIFKAYFHPDSSQKYEFRSEGQDRRLVNMVLDSVSTDLVRKRRREKEVIDLMTDLEDFSESSPVSQSYIRSKFDVEDAAIYKVDLEDTLRKLCDTPQKQAVMAYLLGEKKREEIDINDNNLNVIKHRLQKKTVT